MNRNSPLSSRKRKALSGTHFSTSERIDGWVPALRPSGFGRDDNQLCSGSALPLTHHLREAFKEVKGILRPRARLGVVLHRNDRLARDAEPAVRSIKERFVALLDAFRQRRRVHGEAMVH